MYIKQHPRVYAKPQLTPLLSQVQPLFGFDYVMIVLRRIKLISGCTILSEQEAVFDTRIISWRLGMTSSNSSLLVCYNFTLKREWFTVLDCPIAIYEDVNESTLLYSVGENNNGPNGHYTFDQDSIVNLLLNFERDALFNLYY